MSVTESVTPEAPEFYRPADAAVAMGVSRASVYTMIRAGELSTVLAVLPGRTKPQRVVPADAVREFLAQRGTAVQA